MEDSVHKKKHEDTDWKVYKRTNKGKQLTCVNNTSKYQPTKYSISVQIYASAQGNIYTELGV